MEPDPEPEPEPEPELRRVPRRDAVNALPIGRLAAAMAVPEPAISINPVPRRPPTPESPDSAASGASEGGTPEPTEEPPTPESISTVAEMKLAWDIDSFKAAGGPAKFEEELGEELGVPGRVQVVDLREGSVIVRFVIRPAPAASAGPTGPTPAAAMASLKKLVRAPSASFRRTRLLSRVSKTSDSLTVLPSTLTLKAAPAPSPVRPLELERPAAPGTSEPTSAEQSATATPPSTPNSASSGGCTTPRAMPSPMSQRHREESEGTYQMTRFYTERAEPMLAERYRSDEAVLRRWYTEDAVGRQRAELWGAAKPRTSREWDAKIGGIIDGFLTKAKRRSPSPTLDAGAPSQTEQARQLFVELDTEGTGLDAAGVSSLARQLGRELSGRRLAEALEEMGGGPDDDDPRVQWAELDCWFRLQSAIDDLDYPENMYASFVYEEGVDPRVFSRGELPSMVSMPPERGYRQKLADSRDAKFDYPHRDQVYKDVPRTFSKHPQFEVELLGATPNTRALARNPIPSPSFLLTPCLGWCAGRKETLDETGRFRLHWRAPQAREASGQPPSLINSLQNVLMALVAHSPNGYTQGMNYVAATLLLHRSEEQTFDWLCRILDLYPGFYAGNLWGTRVETGAIEQLLALTPVGEHMQGLGVTSQVFTTGWILPLFCSVMQPLESVTAQVLQHLIALEGRAPDTRLARLSLALFTMHEARLLGTHVRPNPSSLPSDLRVHTRLTVWLLVSGCE